MTRRDATEASDRIANAIIVLRACRVMLDADLAELYGVPTKVLLQAVRRNATRFPADFMFRTQPEELKILRSQFVTSSGGHGGRRYAPLAFTEQGVAMLSSVLRSSRAIAINIEIMRAFVRLREALAANKELARQFAALEARIDKRLADQDQAIVDIMKAIRNLMNQPATTKRPIGFVTEERRDSQQEPRAKKPSRGSRR
ncbi:MAG: ORF6N domain-containing protein [Usitatibacter sp.]